MWSPLGVVVMIPFIAPLERFLVKRVPDDASEVDRARYLNRAALNLSETALAVIELETQHLLDNAVEIMAHGVGIHRADLLSDKSLAQLVEDNRTAIDAAVLDRYYALIKQVYSDFIDYSAEAVEIMSPEEAMKLHGLRIAARNIARAVKDVGLMMDNIERYSTRNGNPAIQVQYDEIRLQIATLLRRLYRIKVTDDLQSRLLGFRQPRQEMEDNDVVANGTIDRLVRNKEITSAMATSLMNDGAHLHDIFKLLIEAGEHLYYVHQVDLISLPEDLMSNETSVGSYDEVRTRPPTGAHPAITRTALTGEYRRIIREDGPEN